MVVAAADGLPAHRNMLTVVVAIADDLPPLKGSFGVLLLSMAAVHH